MSETLRQADSALEETAQGIWSIDCYDVLLARLHERHCQRYACTSVLDGAGLFCHRGFR
jgi:hypothetical protein